MIHHNRPFISPEDRLAVDKVLASGWIAQGSAVSVLEDCFVQQFSGGSACAVSNGTSALYLALEAFETLEKDAEVAVPSYACSALLNAVYMARLKPKVVDVLPDTFCLNPDAIKVQAPNAKFVIAVHTYGAMANITACMNQNRVVIEDCCQAIGGKASDLPLGTIGNASVFSFFATKIITGGQGGLIWSKDLSLIEKIKDYRQFDCRETYKPRFNFQMTDIQAALTNSQMTRLEVIRERRASIGRQYLSVMPRGLSTQAELLESGRMVHRFVVITPDQNIRDALRTHMSSSGIDCAVPIERYELLHRYLNLDPSEFPITERLADTTLSLPIHLCLSDDDVSLISNALYKFQL